MKKNIRSKISNFLISEEGRVSAKAPIALGVATGSVLLAHAIVGTPQAEAGWCEIQDDCDGYGSASYTCAGPWIWINGTLMGTCIPQ